MSSGKKKTGAQHFKASAIGAVEPPRREKAQVVLIGNYRVGEEKNAPRVKTGHSNEAFHETFALFYSEQELEQKGAQMVAAGPYVYLESPDGIRYGEFVRRVQETGGKDFTYILTDAGMAHQAIMDELTAAQKSETPQPG